MNEFSEVPCAHCLVPIPAYIGWDLCADCDEDVQFAIEASMDDASYDYSSAMQELEARIEALGWD